jgi:quinol monooxygenase YgiN
MVLIYGGVLVTESEVPAVTEEARTFSAACQAEEGCVDYLLSWDVAQPSRIRLVEVWATEEAYEAHKAQPHVQKWTDYMKSVSAEAPAFTRHDIAG